MPESSNDKAKKMLASAKAFALKQHLALMLIFAIILAVIIPAQGADAAAVNFTGVCVTSSVCVWGDFASLCVSYIFFVSGLQLASVHPRIGLSKGALLGVLSICFITPCLGIAVFLIRPGMSPVEFRNGVAMFNIAPTTISSGTVICALAGGNVPLSLLLTVVTNILAIFTLPPLLSVLLPEVTGPGEVGGVSIPTGSLILSLIFDLLIPLLLGKMVRESSALALSWIKKHPWFLKLSSSACLCFIPFMRVAQSDAYFSSVAGVDYFTLILAVAGCHFTLLLGNFFLSSKVARLSRPDWITVTIMASQKSMPATLTLIEALPQTALGVRGLVAVAVVVSHLFQTLFDSTFFQWVKQRYGNDTTKKSPLKSSADGGPLLPTAANVAEEEKGDSTKLMDADGLQLQLQLSAKQPGDE